VESKEDYGNFFNDQIIILYQFPMNWCAEHEIYARILIDRIRWRSKWQSACDRDLMAGFYTVVALRYVIHDI